MCNFTMFVRGWHGIILKSVPYLQHDYFSSYNQSINQSNVADVTDAKVPFCLEVTKWCKLNYDIPVLQFQITRDRAQAAQLSTRHTSWEVIMTGFSNPQDSRLPLQTHSNVSGQEDWSGKNVPMTSVAFSSKVAKKKPIFRILDKRRDDLSKQIHCVVLGKVLSILDLFFIPGTSFETDH